MKRNSSTYCVLYVCFLWLIVSCTGNSVQMRQQLEMLEQQNHSGEPMQNDSLADALVSYFDHHGNANERMRSRYILGRTYYCLGELPRALETYYEAVDCADTTSLDCDWAKLSRVYAQIADIYHRQFQPRTELEYLRKGRMSAKRGRDSLMAVECYSLEADVYKYLNQQDSVILVSEKVSALFREIHRYDRASQVASLRITPLIKKGRYADAKRCIEEYEMYSGFFDTNGDIIKGREIYYYIKGEYYLAVNQVDSAECLFRKELSIGKDLNNQIAACKGLQEVYEKKRMTDSIVKYSKFCYELNDSAYSLSEMQNIQKLQASYNFNYHKLLAEQSEKKAQRSLLFLIVVMASVIILVLIAYYQFKSYRKEHKAEIQQYQKDLMTLEKLQTELQDICSEEKLSPSEIFEIKHKEIEAILNRVTEYKRKANLPLATLEERLGNAPVIKRLKGYVNANPYQKASQTDFAELKSLINEEIPHFYTTLNTSNYTLSAIEYDVSLLLRVHFSPMDIHKLTGMSPGYVSNMRSRLLLRVYGIDGSPSDYDKRVIAIS